MLVKLFYTCMCFLCNSRFKSSLELMLCVIDISTLNKTFYICHSIRTHYPDSESTILYSYSWMMRISRKCTKSTNDLQRGHPQVYGGVRVSHLFSLLCLCMRCSVLWWSLWFPHKTMFDSSLPPVVCMRVHA